MGKGGDREVLGRCEYGFVREICSGAVSTKRVDV